MSEKIEFIPAKDLPVAEGDEVDVLCVENGELKRKEGASLGGGGYMFKPAAETVTIESATGSATVTITENCDELIKVLETGGFASILMPSFSVGGQLIVVIPATWTYADGVLIIVSSIMGSSYYFRFTNSTYVPNLG